MGQDEGIIQKIKQVDTFKFLKSIIQKGGYESAIKIRVQLGWCKTVNGRKYHQPCSLTRQLTREFLRTGYIKWP